MPQLYWDDQDQNNQGWYLRYYDATGTEQGATIEADRDASLAQLCEALAEESHWVSIPKDAQIAVISPITGHRCGWVTIGGDYRHI